MWKAHLPLWCIKESLELGAGSISSPNHLDIRQCVGASQNLYRKACQIHAAQVCGVANVLLNTQSHNLLLKVASVNNEIHVFKASQDRWQLIFKSNIAKSYYRQIEFCQLWDITKTLVVARTDASFIALLLSETEGGEVKCETIAEHTNTRGSKIQDIALQNSGALKFAVLRTPRILEIWDLAKAVDEPSAEYDLKVNSGKDMVVEETAALFGNDDGTFVKELLVENSLNGLGVLSRESWLSVSWYDEKSVILAGCWMWRFILKSQTLVSLFPPTLKGSRLNTHLDSAHRKDFAFSCVTQHPDRPWLVYAFSASYHEIFVLDVRSEPVLPIIHLPLPDVYSTRAVHKSVRWISAELAHTTKHRNEIGAKPELDRGEYALVIPPFREAAQGGILHAHCFLIPSLRNIKPTKGLLENPFSFSLNTYSQWSGKSGTSIQSMVGNLEYQAWIAKRLLLKTQMFRFELHAGSTRKKPPLSPPSGVSHNTEAILSKMFHEDGIEEISKCDHTGQSSFGTLCALDVLSLRELEKSWKTSDELAQEPSPLLLARPQCACKAVETGDLNPCVSQTFKFDPRAVDEIGPDQGTVKMTMEGKDPHECARNVIIREGVATQRALPSSYIEREYESDGDDILDMLLNPSDMLAQTQELSTPEIALSMDLAEADLCGHYRKYCSCARHTPLPDIKAETGDEPPLKLSIKGLGLPINKHLINALLAAWPKPSYADLGAPSSRKSSALMIANVTVAKAQRRERQETVQELLGATQAESGTNWFDTFGEGDAGGDVLGEEEGGGGGEED